MLNQNIVREATRLTRAGRLAEATALLQRMLRGESASEPSYKTTVAPAQLEPPTINLEPNVVDGKDSRKSAEAASTQRRQRPASAERMRTLSGFALRGATMRTPTSTTDISPEEAKFVAGTFRSAVGSRAYKLFVPSRSHGEPLPLIVMLHGCTQSPDDFAAGTRMNFLAEERNCFVVYPEQPSVANQSKCWNWFRPGDQQRDGGEPSLIAGITRQIMRDYSVDPKRVYVAGLSAGGAAAAIMATTYPDLYAAVGIHSGLVCGAARDLPSALAAMRQGSEAKLAGGTLSVPTIVFHGDRDTTVHPANGQQLFEQGGKSSRLKAQVIKGRVPQGHAYTRTIVTDARGLVVSEHWNVHGAGHAWSGGSPSGSYTDPSGPDATREMLRFFLEQS